MKHIPHLILILTCVACTNASTPEPKPDPKPTPTASVRFINPNTTVFTNANVQVTLEVTGSPDRLELYRDGNLLATVPSPYTYQWDTTLENEGEHQLMAKAWLGSTAFSSAAVSVKVDRTAPTFTLSPAPGTEGVSVRTPAKAVFSEAIQASTVNAASVSLKGGATDVAHTSLVSIDGKTLTVTPTVMPSAPTTITATLKNTITDLAGNAITPPQAWRWNAPWLLPIDPQPISKAISSTMVLDRNDAPVMVWEEADTTGTRFKLRVKRWNGSGWTPIGSSLSVAPGQSDPHNPTLRLDANDRPVIAWDQYQPEHQKEEIFVRRWDGTTWSSFGDGLYGDPNGVSPNSPSLDLDANGNPVVAWQEDANGNRHIHVRRWNGTGWLALSAFVSALPDDGTYAMSPKLKIAANGTLVLAWKENDTSSRYKLYVKRWNGTAWDGIGEGVSADTDGNGYSNSMSLQLETNGNPVLAWDEFGTNKLNIYAKRWNGTAWVPYANTLKLSAEIDDANGAILALDAQNNPVLVWSERDGFAVSHVFYRRFVNGAWQAINGPFLNKPGHSNFVTALSLDAQGDPVIAWGENHFNQLTAQVVHVNK